MSSEDRLAQLMQMMLDDRRKETEDRKKEKEERIKKEQQENTEREAREEKDHLERERREKREVEVTKKHEDFMKKLMEDQRRDDRAAAQIRKEESRVDSAIAKLPRMTDGEDLEEFVTMVESELQMAEIPEEHWKTALLGHLSQKAKGMVADLLLNQHSTYQEIKKHLLDCSGLSQSMAGELVFSRNQVLTETDVTSTIQTVLR